MYLSYLQTTRFSFHSTFKINNLSVNLFSASLGSTVIESDFRSVSADKSDNKSLDKLFENFPFPVFYA